MENNNILLLKETINKYIKIITVLIENMYVLKNTVILYYSYLSTGLPIYTKYYISFILKYKFYEYYEVILDLIIYLLENN